MTVHTLMGPGGATEARQDAILAEISNVLAELQQKLEPGQAVALDTATLAALESITAVVSGTVSLSSTSLAALETINAVVSGTVALDAASLAALETITAVVSGTVALDAPTLAALETITAVVSGTVALDTPTVTALAQRALAMDQDSVRQTLRVLTPLSVAVTGVLTDHVLIAVGPTQRLRLLRSAGHCDPALALGTYPMVTLKIGGTTIFRDKFEAGLPWSETVCFEGAVGDDLTVSIDQAATFYLNCRYEIF